MNLFYTHIYMSKGRYEINSLIGKGRTGGVYIADDVKLQRKVAMRRFFDSENRIDFTDYKNEFLEVANSLGSVQHSNLSRVFDAGIDDDGAYIISELIKGETLHKELKKGVMEVHEVVELARQMLDALSLLHSQEVYHGALTPRSIFMSPRARGGYRYIILDMGLTKLAPYIKGEDAHLSLMSDHAISAPELFDGSDLNDRVDMYMLGQIIYLCLAGGHPYGGLTATEAKDMHLQGLPPIEEYNSEVPAELEDWLMKVTAPKPEDRFGNAVEALNALPNIPHQPKLAPAPIKKISEANLVKKNTKPVKKVSISKVTAPVPITAPNGMNSITAPVYATGVATPTNSPSSPSDTSSATIVEDTTVNLAEDTTENINNEEVTTRALIRPQKKVEADFFIVIGGLIAVATLAVFIMVETSQASSILDLRDIESQETSE